MSVQLETVAGDAAGWVAGCPCLPPCVVVACVPVVVGPAGSGSDCGVSVPVTVADMDLLTRITMAWSETDLGSAPSGRVGVLTIETHWFCESQ